WVMMTIASCARRWTRSWIQTSWPPQAGAFPGFKACDRDCLSVQVLLIGVDQQPCATGIVPLAILVCRFDQHDARDHHALGRGDDSFRPHPGGGAGASENCAAAW